MGVALGNIGVALGSIGVGLGFEVGANIGVGFGIGVGANTGFGSRKSFKEELVAKGVACAFMNAYRL